MIRTAQVRRAGGRLTIGLVAVALNVAVLCASAWLINGEVEQPEPLKLRPINFEIPSQAPPPRTRVAHAAATPKARPEVKPTPPPRPDSPPQPQLTRPPLEVRVETHILSGPRLQPLPKPKPKPKLKPKPRPKPKPKVKVRPKPKVEPRPEPAPAPEPPQVPVRVAAGSPHDSPATHAPSVAPVGAAGGPDTTPLKLTPPGLISRVPPVYPYFARRRGLEGWVRIRLLVDETGRVDKVEILDADPKRIFDRAVIKAAKRWRFHPAVRSGQAVAATYQTKVRFKLK